jgi:hypothetical protein
MIRAICVVLGPKKSSMYSSEYTSGFSGPAASHLAAPPSPRDEGNVGQAPSPHKVERGSASLDPLVTYSTESLPGSAMKGTLLRDAPLWT